MIPKNDLTSGSVSKNLIRFAIPFLLSNFIQALYSLADLWFVSHFSGVESTSGVNIGSQVTLLVTNLVIGLTVAGSILVAQYAGAKREEDQKKTISTLFTLLLLVALLLTVIMILAAPLILKLINTPERSYGEALSYLRICMLGTVFIFGYNAISSILRGMGDSKRPLYFVSAACASNVILDWLFIVVFKWGASGAAAATIAAQGLSLCMSVIYLYRKKFIFDFKPGSFRISGEKLRLILKIGIPNSTQNIIVNISFLIMTSIVNTMASDAYQTVDASAAVGIVGKFNGFAILPAIAMSASISAMAGQNIGAGKYPRALKTMRTGIIIAMCIGASIFALAQLAPEWVMRLFSDDLPVINAGIQYMRAFSFDYIVVPFFFCMNGLIMGSGHTSFSLIIGMCSSILLRAPAAVILGKLMPFGLTGVGMAAPIATAGAVVIAFIFIQSGRWKKNKLGIAPGESEELSEISAESSET